MKHVDFYNVLGIHRDATAPEIKRAYRELVMRWHPDRNQGDPIAEARFKTIAEAYRVLSDPRERAKYDRYGPLYNRDGRPPTPEDLNNVVSQVWNNLFRRRKPTRGSDLKYNLSITLEEVVQGSSRTLQVPRNITCGTCQGLGAPPSGRRICHVCNGTGKSSGRLLSNTCYHCEGRGYLIDHPCVDCSGTGTQEIRDSITVKVPRGVATGQKLKVAKKGHEPAGQGTAGDLYVVVHVEKHPLFQRRGDDLLLVAPLTIAEAATGTDLPIPTPEGQTIIRIPPGTPHGKRFRLAGRGLPQLKRGRRGDLHVEILVEVPQKLSPEQGRRLKEWLHTLSETHHPQREAFRHAMKERQ